MTQVQNDIDSIAHLDFDPKHGEACNGTLIQENGVKTFDNEGKCPNPAQVRAVRGCCGIIKTYCLECYNKIVSFDASLNGSKHIVNYGYHLSSRPVFSTVIFI